MTKLCALWRNEKNGVEYFRGVLGDVVILVYPVKNKVAGDKRPDYDLLIDNKRRKE